MHPTEINKFLFNRGITQKQICEETGLHKSTVSLLLSGKIKLDHRLDEIAEICGISRKKLDKLIGANGGPK